MRRVFIGSILRVATAAFLLCTHSQIASSAERLTGLYSVQSISYSMPWIAKEAGLFCKYKVDMGLFYLPSSGVANAALLGGDVDLAMAGGVGTVRAYVQGASDLVFIGGFKNALTQDRKSKRLNSSNV